MVQCGLTYGLRQTWDHDQAIYEFKSMLELFLVFKLRVCIMLR